MTNKEMFTMRYLFSFYLIASISLIQCAHGQHDINKHLTLTTKQLLKNNDSIGVAKMFFDDKSLLNDISLISSHCVLYNKIIDKYMEPKEENFIFSKSGNGGNVVAVDLVKAPDSLLNLKKCRILIFFFPDMLINEKSKNKFLDYIFEVEKIIQTKKPIIEGAEIIVGQ